MINDTEDLKSITWFLIKWAYREHYTQEFKKTLSLHMHLNYLQNLTMGYVMDEASTNINTLVLLKLCYLITLQLF